MTTHQVLFLLLDLALIIIVARLLGSLFQKFGQPAVIGEVLAGILMGPSLFGESFSSALFPMDTRPFLLALANVGVALFMFLVGLELDGKLLRGRGRIAVTVSVSSIIVPFGLGALLALYLITQHPAEQRLGFILFMGAAMSVTAFPVLARILTDRRMHKTTLGGLALTCAAVDDVLAWSMLAVVVALTAGATDGQWLMLMAVPYVVLMFGAVRPLLRRALASTERLGTGQLAIVMVGLLLSGAATEWIGLHFLFGAFLFGVIMPREGTERLREDILDRLRDFNATMLLPVFFIVAGLKVDLSGIGLAGLGELALVLLVAIGGKFGGAYAGARLHRLPKRKSAALATLMNTRGLTELIILSVGLQYGVLDQSLYSIMVVMALVTTGMAGPLLNTVYPSAMVERDQQIDNALARREVPVAT